MIFRGNLFFFKYFIFRTADFKSSHTNINGVLVTDKNGLVLASMLNSRKRKTNFVFN